MEFNTRNFSEETQKVVNQIIKDIMEIEQCYDLLLNREDNDRDEIQYLKGQLYTSRRIAKKIEEKFEYRDECYG
jgi:hypothetical protein